LFGSKPGPGREVTNSMIIETLRGCRIRGVDATPLLEVFGGEREAVLNPRGRCNWEHFAVFQDRTLELLGGSRAMEDMIAGLMRGLAFMRIFASIVANVRSLYLIGMERIGRSALPHIGGHIEQLDDDRLSLEATIPDRYRGCIALHHGTIGLMRAYPTLLGLPEAIVDAEVAPRRLFASISLPHSKDLRSRLQRSIRSLANRFHDDSGDFLPDVFDEASIEERSRELAQALDRSQDLPTLADNILQIFRDAWCTRWARLEWMDGASIRYLDRGGPAPARRCSRTLTIGDREVGRLLVDHPALVVDADSPMLRRIIVHVSAALDKLIQPHGAPRRERGEDLALRWRLPKRQQEALLLLLRGLSNKEIAGAMGCSVKGIEAHVSRLLRRAGVTSRAELISRCSG
jgi:DNA-binding CsgD family transcriptional regulator